MRLAIALVLLLHGLAHLVGFLTPWNIGLSPVGRAAAQPITEIFGGRVRLGTVVSRGLSVVWLAVALAFVTVAFGWWLRSTWSLGALLGVILVSLALTLVWWPTARIGVAVNVGLLTGLTLIGVVQFRSEMSDARERVVSQSTVLHTASGPIEYATLGEGTPILALHGTAGGWDQGLLAASEITRYGFRVVAPSRFGYLRTPWRSDASPTLEADTWALLLDSLGIGRVAVMSWSAGATPAMQFALRHPDRVSKLVFFVPASGGIVPPTKGPPPWLVRATFKWDFPIWAAQRLAPKAMLWWVAVPAALLPSLAPADRAMLDDVIDGIFPVSARRDGILYDGRSQSGAVGLFPIERVSAPTLWISAKDDLFGTERVARHGAATVPGAKLLIYDAGGHLLLGDGADIWPRVAEFLRD
jgi:2-hydroxy-6-oxonona-2,4-dienedioate hydrolase